MSPAPVGGRQLLTGIETAGTFPVEYRFTHGQKGNRHLVVVFANFSAPSDYGWSNGVFDKLRANILWIRDRFEGEQSYYLCKEMDFALEQSVVTLISKVMEALDLTADSVTLWGGSKGGSAALYFGLKYGFRNIVALVPQFSIGTYVKNERPATARFMLGEGVPEENVRTVDSLIPDLVRSGANRTANIYLLSSLQDEQYPVQVEPFLGLFWHYENFNFVLSDSPHIADHTQVTGRNVPMLMGLVNFLIDGIAPRLGSVRNGFEEPDRDRSAIDSYLTATALVRGAEFPPPAVAAPGPRTRVHRNTVRFEGRAPGAVRVAVWEHGRYLGQTGVAADGTWSWELGRPWGVGEHLVKLYGVDAAGFQSRRTELGFTAVDDTRADSVTPAAPPARDGGAMP
ncbi:accessory Sec system protein Asp2 [Streptomyces populi]|uniref:accessory Sec system protein Asp2 n=1 Tax=Streptomyces populi TaxID=2058924 RepID=UPI0019D212C6